MLFSRGVASDGQAAVRSAIAYPLRAVWRVNSGRSSGSPVQFLISVPKKRLRHAVDRVQMRRRIREAYRLNRHSYLSDVTDNIDLAFIYIADGLKDYAAVEKSIHRILHKISTDEQPAAQ